MKTTYTYQIIIAVVLVGFGVVLIIVAFWVPPMGVIDPTVLTAFGELLTFSGSIMGLDYHYKGRTLSPTLPHNGEGV